MRTTLILTAIALSGILAVGGCNSEESENTPSGTYEGKITKVVPAENEIYVETADDRELELYFVDSTKLTRGAEEIDWKNQDFGSLLKEGMEVKVRVENIDGKLKPVAVSLPVD
ncbi:MAG: hypothetical protein ACLFUJ_04635 [Phycisphaerae bacterium]